MIGSKYLFLFLLGTAIIGASISCKKVRASETIKLWFNKPASSWVEALPVGNGRIGAMVYGGTKIDTIQINEESLWGGTKIDDNNAKASEMLPQIQKLFLEGDIDKATEMAKENMLGIPPRLRSYQTLMNLVLDYGNRKITDYRRELDLVNGISRVDYKSNGAPFTQEVFSSLTQDVLVVKLKSAAPFNVNVRLSRTQDADVISISDNQLLLSGQVQDIKYDEYDRGPEGAHMKFAAHIEAVADEGTVRAKNKMLMANAVKELTLYINGATNYDFGITNINTALDEKKISKLGLGKAMQTSYEDLKNEHKIAFSSIMNRVDLQLKSKDYDSIPTNDRLTAYHNGNDDLGLIETYFQFGRYLLLSSGHKTGRLPANLQGIWNKDIHAIWNSDYHTNINLQMNYWPMSTTNLPETVGPLSKFVGKMAESGAVTAKDNVQFEWLGGKSLHRCILPYCCPRWSVGGLPIGRGLDDLTALETL